MTEAHFTSDEPTHAMIPSEERLLALIRDHRDESNGGSLLAYAMRWTDWSLVKFLLAKATDYRLYVHGPFREDHLLEELMIEGLRHPEARELAVEVAVRAPLDFLLQAHSQTGNTPLHFAAWYGYDEVIAIIRDRLTQTESPALKNPGWFPNHWGETPLLFAMVNLQADVVDVLAADTLFPEPDPAVCTIYGAAVIAGMQYHTKISTSNAQLEAWQDHYYRIMNDWSNCCNRDYKALQSTLYQCFDVEYGGAIWHLDTTSIENFATFAG
jgi:hypothetical protein